MEKLPVVYWLRHALGGKPVALLFLITGHQLIANAQRVRRAATRSKNLAPSTITHLSDYSRLLTFYATLVRTDTCNEQQHSEDSSAN